MYVSFYLDRLLKVDDREYTHQNVGFFYITWIDYTAADKMVASTAKMLNGSGTACEPGWSGDTHFVYSTAWRCGGSVTKLQVLICTC